MSASGSPARGGAPATTPLTAAAIARLLVRNWLEALCAVMLVAICIVVFAGVFFRYFLHIGLGWTEEAARYVQVWMAFAGATVAVKRWGHFQLTIINQWVPPAARRLTQIFAVLVVAALAVVMVVNGIDITRVSWNQTSPIMEWRIGYLYLVAPVSGALMLWYSALHLRRLIAGGALPGHDAHGAANPEQGAAIDAHGARGEIAHVPRGSE